MNHYLRFVRSLAITGTFVACGSPGDTTPAKSDSPPLATDASTREDADASSSANVDRADASLPLDQVEVDAEALADAKQAPVSSGPLAPPELPAEFRV